MRKRMGLHGALGAIAMGVVLGASSPSVAQESDIDLAVVCEQILATTTRPEFRANVQAVAALENEDDVCHELALAHWRRLQGNSVQTSSIGDNSGTYSYR